MKKRFTGKSKDLRSDLVSGKLRGRIYYNRDTFAFNQLNNNFFRRNSTYPAKYYISAKWV